jgi:hypothetical protein
MDQISLGDGEESSIFTSPAKSKFSKKFPSAQQLNFMMAEMTTLEKKGISLTTAPAGDGEWADDEGSDESEDEEQKQEEEPVDKHIPGNLPTVCPIPPAIKPPASFVNPKLETLDYSQKKPVVLQQNDAYTLKYRVADDVFARLHESNRLRELKLRGDSWQVDGAPKEEEEEVEEEDNVVVPTMTEEEQSWVEAGAPDGPLKVVDAVDSWEDLVAEEDTATSFPCLLVNLSNFWTHHKLQQLSQEDHILQFSDMLQQKLHGAFEGLSGELFDLPSICFHSTLADEKQDMERLKTQFPECTIVRLDYPVDIDGKSVQELWDGVVAKTKWESVNEVKTCLAQTNKSLKWKFSVVTEVELLAESSSAQMEQSGVVDAGESVEGAEGQAYEGVVPGMGLLDRLICMMFASIPRELSVDALSADGLMLSEDAHYTSLANKHELLRRLWKNDFGFLP